jgi:hypothetical protein
MDKLFNGISNGITKLILRNWNQNLISAVK